MKSQADVSPKNTAEDLTKILEKIEKSEQKLERKIDYISVEVCKLQDTDSFGMPSYLKTVCNFQENVACNIWKKTSRAIIALKKRRV